MKRSRFSQPKDKYDPKDEAEFRRAVLESLSDNEFSEIRIAGGTLSGENGSLIFRSSAGTRTVVGPL